MNRVFRRLPETGDLAALPIREEDVSRARAAALHGIRHAVATEGVFARVQRQARLSPDALAVIDDLRAISYAALTVHVRALASALSAAGVRDGHIVAVGGPRGAGSLVAFLSIEALGAVYTPVDPHWPAARIEHVLASTAAAAVVATGGLQDLEALAGAAAAQQCPIVTVDWEARAGVLDPVPPCAADAPRYVLFTSGSTGVPKGAVIEHQGMMNHVQAKIADLRLCNLDCVAQSAPLTFDVSIWQMLAPLFVGASVRFLGDEEISAPDRLIEAVRVKGITILEVVPSMLRLIMDEVDAAGGADLGSLRSLLTVGEALPPSLAGRWIDAFDAALINVYGPTELSDNVTHHVVAAPREGEPYTPIGYPIPNVSLYLLREEAGQFVPCDPGSSGELFAGGICVGRGYLGDEARTRSAFFRDPFSDTPTGRLYRTGDLARYAPGRGLEYLGRIDRQVKVRGVRIEPGEIEETLRGCAGISDAAVVVAGKDTEHAAIVACVCGPQVDVAGLRAHALQHLPTSMVPQRFITLESMPVTPNGKLDYGALAILAARQGETARGVCVDQNLLAEQVRVLQEHAVTQPGVEMRSWPSGQYVLQALAVLAGGGTLIAPAEPSPRAIAPANDLGGVLLAAGTRLPHDLSACVLDSQMRPVRTGTIGRVYLLQTAPAAPRAGGSAQERAFLPTGRFGRHAADGTIELVENI